MAELALLTRQGADIASASTIALDTQNDLFNVTGTTGITTIDTLGRGNGARFLLHFVGVVTLTNSSGLALKGGSNYTTAAGDDLEFAVTGTNQVRQVVRGNTGSGGLTQYSATAAGLANNGALVVTHASDPALKRIPTVLVAGEEVLFHFDGANGAVSTVDTAGVATPVFVGAPALSTTQFKYGVSSLHFPGGNGDSLDCSGMADVVNFGSNDFSIGCWMYPEIISGAPHILDNRDIHTCGNWVMEIAADKMYFLATDYDPQSAWRVEMISSNSVVANEWHHWAVVRNGSAWTMYCDGVVVATATYSMTIPSNTTVPFRIGNSQQASDIVDYPGPFQGYIDDLQIINGLCKYPAAFTPPTIPAVLGSATFGGIGDSAGWKCAPISDTQTAFTNLTGASANVTAIVHV